MNQQAAPARNIDPPLSSIAAASSPSLPWLARLPAALFAIPVGLFDLAGAWHRAAYQWTPAAGIAAALL